MPRYRTNDLHKKQGNSGDWVVSISRIQTEVLNDLNRWLSPLGHLDGIIMVFIDASVMSTPVPWLPRTLNRGTNDPISASHW